VDLPCLGIIATQDQSDRKAGTVILLKAATPMYIDEATWGSKAEVASMTLRMLRHAALIAALSAIFIVPLFGAEPPAHDRAIVEWYAKLAPYKNSSPRTRATFAETQATGRVMASFDFEHQIITFHVEAKDLPKVGKIEVRAAGSSGDFIGPTIFTIYDSHDGPFTGSLTRVVPSQFFKHVATPILNGQAAVVVSTDSNPDGEIAGVISMYKRYEK
jgi:hypothetical protein